MSGGIAYILDEEDKIDDDFGGTSLNVLSVDNQKDQLVLQGLIQEHYLETSSEVARNLLDNWPKAIKCFKKIFPEEYRLALDKLAKEQNLERDLINA